MVGLKKFFNTGASPRPGRNAAGAPTSQDLTSFSSMNDVSYASSIGPSTPGPMSLFPPDLKPAAMLDVNHHFLGIEKQFEQLHEQFHSRPLSSLSHLRYNETNSVTEQNPRHVDVIDALFTTHRFKIASRSLSPTTPYNEDVADRNLQPPAHKSPERNAYSRIVSAIYQEDVADRNIASSRSNTSFRSSLSSQQAWRPGTGHTSESGSVRRNQRPVNAKSRELHGGPKASSSHENLRPTSKSPEKNFATRRSSRMETSLRPQVSAPDLSGEHGFRRALVTSASDGSYISAGNEPGETAEMPYTFPIPGNRPFVNDGSKSIRPSDPSPNLSVPDARELSRPVSRKNIRDLSINTELASSKKPAIKIEHCAIQPPTPSNHRSVTQNASIAEIVNSPLPAASPTLLTPQTSSSYNVEEIMNMFKQAYITTQATSPHPTFETLQDAIVREINSHDAFRRVPVPDAGPPFTPATSQQSFSVDEEGQVSLSRPDRNPAERESQFVKLIRKGPSIRKRGKSISSTNQLKSQDRTPKRESQSFRTKRRHTYAQPPSAEWIQTFRSDNPETTGAAPPMPPNPPVFKYHLKRKSDPAPPSPGMDGFSRPMQPAGPPSYQLRAHQQNHPQSSLTPDMAWRNRHQDEIPHNQIRAIDGNNVTYILNATKPLTPLELITASQKVSNKRGAGVIERLEVHRSRSASPFQTATTSKRPIPLRRSSLHCQQQPENLI